MDKPVRLTTDRPQIPIALCYPAVVFWLLSQRARGQRLRYLAMCNPAMPFSGLFGVSKIDLTNICSSYGVPLPEAFIVPADDESAAGRNALARYDRWIAKPEFGARSKGIRMLTDQNEINDFMRVAIDRRWLVQRYVEGEEFSAFLLREPATGSLGVRHMIRRVPLVLVGDGVKTIDQLAAKLSRNKRRAVRQAVGAHGACIPDLGAPIAVSKFGTRASGTDIVEMHAPYPPAVLAIALSLERWQGLDYCRVDMMREDATGEWVVLEINGALAVPLHAYDSEKSLVASYRAFTESLRSALALGQSVYERGGAMPGRMQVIKGWACGWWRYHRAQQ